MAFLDTHKAIERIINTGVSKETAEAIVDTLNTKNDDVATKSDISRLESKIDINMKWILAIGVIIIGILLKNTLI
jgi:sporulation protein YlmC with PRC-barrel domain